jgi:hypothetical protein
MRLAVLLLAAAALAAPPPKPVRRQIKVPVWVDDDAAQALSAKDLSARLEGNDSRIVAVKGPADDLVVMTVLDLTGEVAFAEPAKQVSFHPSGSFLLPHGWRC